MNRKQIISMWLGIAVFVLIGLDAIGYGEVYLWRSGSRAGGKLILPNFIVLWICISVVTAGLIYTFRDEKRPEGEARKPVNLRRGFRRLTLLLAIVAAVICGCIAVASFGYNRIRSQNHLSYCENELFKTIPVEDLNERPAGWPRWSSDEDYSDFLLKLSQLLEYKQVNLPLLTGEEDKKYREEHNVPPDSTDRFYTEEAVKFREKYGSCVEKARLLIDAYNFWVGLSAKQFISLLVLGGLGCAIAGFCGVGLAYFIVRLVHKLINWLKLGFRVDTG